MNAAQVLRFATRAEATIAAIWPAHIRIAGIIYPCAASGIVNSEDFADIGGGARTRGSRFFRVPRASLPALPKIGAVVEYLPSGPTGPVEKYTYLESADDTHTSAWRLHCQPYTR